MTLPRHDPYKAYIGIGDQQGRVMLVPDSSSARYDPYKAYIGIQDQQGRVTLVPDSPSGGVARAGWGEILGFSFLEAAPVAGYSSAPTGKRQHKPFIVKMRAGANGPILLRATSQFARTIALEIFERGKGGSVRMVNRVTLTNARIISIGIELVAGGASRSDLAHRLEIDVEHFAMLQPCNRWPA
jgi:hypothetical protein